MAFGGAGRAATLVDDYSVLWDDATLALFVANPPAIANADTGELVTAAAAANQDALPAAWGPGRGNWVAADANRVRVIIHDTDAITQGAAGQASLVHLVDAFPVVATGNLSIRFHNRGLLNSGILRIWLLYQNFQKAGDPRR